MRVTWSFSTNTPPLPTCEDRCQFARDPVAEGALVELEDLLQGLLQVLLITIPLRCRNA